MAQYASQARTAGVSAAEVTATLKQHAAAKEPAVLLRMELAAGRLTMAEYAQQVHRAAAHALCSPCNPCSPCMPICLTLTCVCIDF